ncbi:MAG: hypothetical protein HKN92_01705 [Chitinophagales bacterium]|nr:hypothetical protein [Chitinophagales bacterium]
MKKIPFLLIIASLAFYSCSEQNDPDPGYAANEALIHEDAQMYLIADVEGLSGVNKINYQDVDPEIQFGQARGSCDPGYGGYQSSAIENDGTTETWFTVFFRGKCPQCEWEDLVVTGNPRVAHNLERHNGIALGLSFNNSEFYYSNTLSSEELSDDIFVIESLTPTGQSIPSHYFEARFNMTLKKLNSEETIRIENAVLRMSTDDVK